MFLDSKISEYIKDLTQTLIEVGDIPFREYKAMKRKEIQRKVCSDYYKKLTPKERKERINYSKKYYEQNREKMLKQMSKNYKKNREIILKYKQEQEQREIQDKLKKRLGKKVT